MHLPSELTDEHLTARGDRDCVELLYQRHASSLLAFLAGLAGSELAEDLHHDTWLNAMKQLPGKFPGHSFRKWLTTTARNAFIDHTRKKRPVALATDPADTRATPAEPLLDEARSARLRDCLEKLRSRSAESAQVFVAMSEGMNVQMICEKLQLQPQQVHKRKSQAVVALQECVGRTEP